MPNYDYSGYSLANRVRGFQPGGQVPPAPVNTTTPVNRAVPQGMGGLLGQPMGQAVPQGYNPMQMGQMNPQSMNEIAALLQNQQTMSAQQYYQDLLNKLRYAQFLK